MTDNPDLAEAIDILRNARVMMPTAMTGRIDALLAKYPERPKLLPCPFCGGPAQRLRFTGATVSQVECSECRIGQVGMRSDDEAIAAWNRRATPASGPLSGGKTE